MKIHARVPVIGFTAYSGTGKTTLLVRILVLMQTRGLHVGVIKHAHHSFEIDHPGKDSYELRHAGASQMLIGSRQRWALITETPASEEAGLQDYLDRLDQDRLDLVLVEGFKLGEIPKIELHRPSLGKPLLCRHDPSIIAVAHDAPAPLAIECQQLDINNPTIICNFIMGRFLPRFTDQFATSFSDEAVENKYD